MLSARLPLVLVVLALAGGDVAHQVKDELPADFGAAQPFGLAREVRPRDEARAALGRKLFFDPRLSRDGSVSCASCHLPEHGFADPRAHSVGVEGRTTPRNAPSLLNRALGKSFFWDGRIETLEQQVLQPIENENEMGNPVEEALARIGGGLSRDELGAALAEFVRGMWIGDSPVDRFQGGEFSALGVEERLGLWVYESKGRCWRCHSGPNFSDEDFHDTGVGVREGEAEEGRMHVTHDERDRGRFKTPTLRGVALSAPYMHDGSQATLEDVVAFYKRGGNANPGLDTALEGIEITDEDARNLVAFLKALSRTAEGERTGR
ncbi:MAG: cytochrome-c peroxidase [Planctomycetes bacterium]|nr:cytochrome-c peroxidase [Planctomycetota bacterium]